MKQAADYKDQLVLIAIHNEKKRIDALTALYCLIRLEVAELRNNHTDMLYDASEFWDVPAQIIYIKILYYGGLKEEAAIQLEFVGSKYPQALPELKLLQLGWTLPSLNRPVTSLRRSWGRASARWRLLD